MERITWHRDISPTACPGNDMYARMPSIRQAVQAVIDDCNNVVTDQIAPSTNVTSTYEWRGHDFWTMFDDTDNPGGTDRKSTRLNSSHVRISYAVFCLKKKKF